MVVDDIEQQRIDLLERGLAPAYIILGRQSYLTLRVESRHRMSATWTVSQYAIAQVCEAAELPPPVTERILDIPVVCDPALEHYVRVVPVPSKAALM